MSDDLEPTSLGQTPEEIDAPDAPDSTEIPDQTQYIDLPEQEQPNPEIEALKAKVLELGMMLNRLVEAHDENFGTAEQALTIQRMQEQISVLEAKGARAWPDANNDASPLPYIWLGKDDTTHVVEQVVNSNTIVNAGGGRTINTTDALTIASTQAFYVDYQDMQVMRRVKISGGGTGTMFPVALTKTGGSAGDTSSKCSFTYTVKDITGVTTLGTGIVPEQQTDYNNGKRKESTIGWGFMDSGTVRVFCIEDRTVGAC